MAIANFIHKNNKIIAIIALCIVIFVTRAPYYGDPTAIFDDQLYSFIGNKMLDGYLPYVDLWDRKPIGLFLLFAAAHAIGGPGPEAYQIMASLFCLAGSLLLWRIAARFTTPVTAAFAMLFYPVLMAQYGSYTAQAEGLFTPFLLAIALFTLKGREAASIAEARKYYFLAMAMGGIALQIKYSVAAVCLWFGLLALKNLYDRGQSYRDFALSALYFGIIGLFPTLVATAAYYLMGHGDEFIFANFISIGYRKAAPTELMIEAQLVLILPLLVLTLLGIVSNYGGEKSNRAPLYGLALGWLAFSAAGLFLGTTIYTYYYAALVPAVIIALLPAISFARNYGRILYVILFSVLLLLYNPADRYYAHQQNKANFAHFMDVLQGAIGKSKQTVLVYDGPMAVYGLLDNPLPSKYIYPDHLNNALEEKALPVDQTEEVGRILAKRPVVIVTSKESVTVQNPKAAALLRQELERNYHLVSKLPVDGRMLEIYRDKRPE